MEAWKRPEEQHLFGRASRAVRRLPTGGKASTAQT